MKITKEKLKELAAEIIAEDAGELKEFFGLFGIVLKTVDGIILWHDMVVPVKSFP